MTYTTPLLPSPTRYENQLFKSTTRDNNHLNPVVTELKHTFETAVYTATDFNMTHLQWGYTLWDNSLISIDKTVQSTN